MNIFEFSKGDLLSVLISLSTNHILFLLQDNMMAELQATKTTMEKVYENQKETLVAEYDHNKANALAELSEELLDLHRNEMATLEGEWKDKVARMEEMHQADMLRKQGELRQWGFFR